MIKNINKRIRSQRRSNEIDDLYPSFIIATEGTKTEIDYFRFLKEKCPRIRLNCFSGKFSNPISVLKTLQHRLSTVIDKFNEETDQAWVVIDKDSWEERDLEILFKESKKYKYLHIAVSNPKFEFWLLLHFDNKAGAGAKSSAKCTARLKQFLPGYDKHLAPNVFTLERVKLAVMQAEKLDTPPCDGWPREEGVTTVYRLVKNILQVMSGQNAKP